MVPGRKFSATTSAVAISLRRISLPSSDFRLSDTLFLPRERFRIQREISLGSVLARVIPLGPK